MLDWGIYDDIEVSLAFLSYTKKVVGDESRHLPLRREGQETRRRLLVCSAKKAWGGDSFENLKAKHYISQRRTLYVSRGIRCVMTPVLYLSILS